MNPPQQMVIPNPKRGATAFYHFGEWMSVCNAKNELPNIHKIRGGVKSGKVCWGPDFFCIADRKFVLSVPGGSTIACRNRFIISIEAMI